MTTEDYDGVDPNEDVDNIEMTDELLEAVLGGRFDDEAQALIWLMRAIAKHNGNERERHKMFLRAHRLPDCG